jgi:hypothetical protein
MKMFLMLLVLTLCSSFVLSQTDTNKPGKTPEKELKKEKLLIFIDKNGDGINDFLQSGQKGKKDVQGNTYGKDKNAPAMDRKKDFFIDEDGDGICDFRAKGMSFGIKNKTGTFSKGQIGKTKKP